MELCGAVVVNLSILCHWCAVTITSSQETANSMLSPFFTHQADLRDHIGFVESIEIDSSWLWLRRVPYPLEYLKPMRYLVFSLSCSSPFRFGFEKLMRNVLFLEGKTMSADRSGASSVHIICWPCSSHGSLSEICKESMISHPDL